MYTTECEQPRPEEDRCSVLYDDVTSHYDHDHHQLQQLQDQLKQACERELSVVRQLQSANTTIEDLREQLEGRLDAIQGLRYELETSKRKETELQQQLENEIGICGGQSDAVTLLEMKAPIGDMLYAFLSHTLMSNQQSLLLDRLTAKNIITTEECREIEALTTVEEKVLMLVSKLRQTSTAEIEHWLAAISIVGQKQLVEGKLQTFGKYKIAFYYYAFSA